MPIFGGFWPQFATLRPYSDKFCAKRREDSYEIYTTESSPRWDYTVSLAVQCPFDPTDPPEAS